MNGEVVVTLTWPELTYAGLVGVMRNVSALKRGRRHRWGYEGDAWANSINGTAAEMAVAAYLDHYWTPLAEGAPSELPGDVGVGVQVRATDRPDGSLILHADDPADHVFYLVIAAPPRFTLAGYLLGAEGQDARFWRDAGVRHPAFFVPQHALHPCKGDS